MTSSATPDASTAEVSNCSSSSPSSLPWGFLLTRKNNTNKNSRSVKRSRADWLMNCRLNTFSEEMIDSVCGFEEETEVNHFFIQLLFSGLNCSLNRKRIITKTVHNIHCIYLSVVGGGPGAHEGERVTSGT